MRLSPELALTSIVTVGVGVGMVRMGLWKGLFEARVDSRRCPSCDRIVRARHCPRCSRS
jgi:hypothetical protein